MTNPNKTRFLWQVPLAAIALALSQPALAAAQDDYEALRADIWEWELDNNPMLATEVGDRRGDGSLGDGSLEAMDRRTAEQRAFLSRLDAIDVASLPENLKIDHAIVRRSLADSIASDGFAHARFGAITNRWGPHGYVSYLPQSSPFFTLADYESYLGRIEDLPATIDATIARSRGAIANGLTLPCEAMVGYEKQVDSSIVEQLDKSPLWQPFTTRPDSIGQQDWAPLLVRARSAISKDANASLAKFARFYRSEYMPACRTGAPGLAATKGGKEYYDYLVRSYTTTEMSADEVHKLGLSEVARIRAEMETVASKAGYPTREAFIEHLRTDPQYYAKTPEELIMRNAAVAKHIDGFMPRLFGRLAEMPYTVEPIPAATAPGNTTAYYTGGSFAAGKPGIYWVNTTELDQRPLWEVPVLTVHEAVPGHHQQIAIQQELDLHPLRRHGTFFTAFVEGWGLYSERLGIEMGLYDTPAKEMGRLSYEMWRATRLVVDTGMHAKGWSKAQAIAYMTDNTALSPSNIEAEVNRYITMPGQALAYKLGELKIRELRSRAETALGEKFDLRGFHDAVLENGAVPLDVLEAHIDGWIAGQQA